MEKTIITKPNASSAPVAKPAMPVQPATKPEVKPVAQTAAVAAASKPAPAAVPKAGVPEKRQVAIECYQRSANSVFVAGSFNGWDPQTTPLQNLGTGKWEIKLMLAPGRYEYRFVVDGQWIEDPLVKDSVPNPFGGANSVLTVK